MAVTIDLLDQDSDHGAISADDCCLGCRNSEGLAERHEINEAGAALSDEAWHLLKRASRSLLRRRHRRRSIVEPLYRQLKSLRAIIPHSTSSRTSCVISDALGYLEQLRTEIQDLKDGLQTSRSTKRLQDLTTSAVVEVTALDARLKIHVSCQKRTGMMADLMEALEGLGLIFEEVNVSCQNDLIFDASCTQVGGHSIDTETVKRVLWKAICQ